MTREEAIKLLTQYIDYDAETPDYYEMEKACKVALKVLKQEPCKDCISRTEAIEALGYDISIESDEGIDAYKTVIKEMLCKIYDVQKENIEKLPSIKPKTDVLDKIIAEIESHIIDSNGLDFNSALCIAIEIIDKYKAESEE